MGRPLCGLLLVVGAFFSVIAAIAFSADSKDEAIQKDRQQIEGTWRVVTLEVDGNQAMEDDAKKLTVVNGADGTWSLHSEGKEISKGTSIIDPTKTPKTIDFEPSDGDEKDVQRLGIYELGENTRKFCFASPGAEWPTDFVSRPGSKIILVTLQRQKAK